MKHFTDEHLKSASDENLLDYYSEFVESKIAAKSLVLYNQDDKNKQEQLIIKITEMAFEMKQEILRRMKENTK